MVSAPQESQSNSNAAEQCSSDWVFICGFSCTEGAGLVVFLPVPVGWHQLVPAPLPQPVRGFRGLHTGTIPERGLGGPPWPGRNTSIVQAERGTFGPLPPSPLLPVSAFPRHTAVRRCRSALGCRAAVVSAQTAGLQLPLEISTGWQSQTSELTGVRSQKRSIFPIIPVKHHDWWSSIHSHTFLSEASALWKISHNIRQVSENPAH